MTSAQADAGSSEANMPGRRSLAAWVLPVVAAGLLFALPGRGTPHEPDLAVSVDGGAAVQGDGGASSDADGGEVPRTGDYHVPPPPFTEGVFPCSDCHNADREPDKTRRELSEHEFKFEHDPEQRWCFDCHNIGNYDTLRLASGEELPFNESYRLCGQCHGDKYRDWRAGVHGRRSGQWDGVKNYLLCVNCHNPHSPRFKPIKPEPPPERPRRSR